MKIKLVLEKKCSCTDHIFTLHSLFEIIRKRKKKLFVAFIDFSQAFDKVWRKGLWYKLLQNNINGKFFNVVTNMYNNIKSCIKLDGHFSPNFVSEMGVRQGENLSPVLFSLFLNDLETHMRSNGAVGVELNEPVDSSVWLKLLIMLYADDTVILSDNETDFQNSLNTFNNYCNNWHLKVNINKTKVIIFGARKTSQYNFKLGESSLEIISKYHYLGVTFSNNGSFLHARKHLVEQTNKAMHFLYTKIDYFDLPLDLVLKLFDHTVLPILTYGSEVFGFENLEILEKVHTNFLRKITNSRKSTPLHFLYGELGRYPISIVTKSRMISFWNRILLGKSEKYCTKIYKYMLSLPEGSFKWLDKIKEILTSVGRLDLWVNQFLIEQKNIHKGVKQILIDQFKQNWHDQLQQSNKGKIYSNFKMTHEFEDYLTQLNRREYLQLFKFRTANHLLPIETGRYDGTPLEDRTCTLCNSNAVGSEIHYLFYCSFFNDKREMFLLNNFNRHELNVKDIFNLKSVVKLKHLCQYVNCIMQNFTR